MKVKNLVYLDSFIKIFLVRTEEKEIKKISPALVKHAIIHYSIGLVANKGTRIKESVKVDPNDIEFAEDYVIISFMLEGLRDPYECEIIIHTLTVFLKEGSLIRLKIEETKQFRYVTSELPEIILKRESPNVAANRSSKPQKEEGKKGAQNTGEKTSEYFKNTYEKFKTKIQDSDLIELIRCKTNTIDFSLKNFGISLLCKLLLLIKYVNELVDNDFQSDLQEFLKENILKSIEKEELMT
ncbi:hypothetical protein ES703_114731 [subsurface metagenome]